MNPPPLRHPAEDTLLRHAAGRLPFGHALVVATHLPFCPECQTAIRLNEAIGGVLLGSLPPAELAPDAMAQVLARLDGRASVVRSEMETVKLADGVPLPAALRGRVQPVWRWLAPGLSRITVIAAGAARDERIWLLRIGAGTRLPEHHHAGWEAACVLAGSFSDSTGEYRAGDVAELDGDERHQPVAGAGQPCICLLAWEGPLRLRGLAARLMQPLIGI